MKQNQLYIGLALAAAAAWWWYSRRAVNPTAAPTSLIVGQTGLTPIIDDLSAGQLFGSTTKAIA